MARMPGAVWKPLPRGFTVPMTGHDIICEHTMVGSLAGTDGYFRGLTNGVNSHYGTGGLGEVWQWGDTRFRSGANLNGNPNVVTIENADMGPGFGPWNTKDGNAVPAFTPAQIEANARILAWESSRAAHAACPSNWLCHKYGIPLEVIPDAKPGRRGIGYHRQGVPGYMAPGAVKWSSATGKVCPGNRRIAQIPQIIARARQIAAGNPTPQQEDEDMFNDWDRAMLTEACQRVQSISYPTVPQPKWLPLDSYRVVDILDTALRVEAELVAQRATVHSLVETISKLASGGDDVDVDALVARIGERVDTAVADHAKLVKVQVSVDDANPET